MARCPLDVCFQGAGSTGRRNTGVNSLCWGFKLQGLTWSFVELTSHFVQIGLRVHRQVGALWKVLSQQAIGVLVRPALPRALRIEKMKTVSDWLTRAAALPARLHSNRRQSDNQSARDRRPFRSRVIDWSGAVLTMLVETGYIEDGDTG